MCLFDKNDLFDLLNNEKLFSLFVLMKREKFILRAHVQHNQTFLSMGALLGMSDSRAHYIYKRAIKKIKKQGLTILEEEAERQNKVKAGCIGYIAGNGKAWYGSPENAPVKLSVLAVGLGRVG